MDHNKPDCAYNKQKMDMWFSMLRDNTMIAARRIRGIIKKQARLQRALPNKYGATTILDMMLYMANRSLKQVDTIPLALGKYNPAIVNYVPGSRDRAP